jgi:hypothetical protein
MSDLLEKNQLTMKLRKIKSSLAVCLLSLCSAQFAQSEIADVFIATGQPNAFWGDNPDNSGYLFGHGVQDALVASGQFSNPVVVIQGEPSQSISGWPTLLSPRESSSEQLTQKENP